MSIWTAEKIADLKKLYAEGLSCAHIAARMGGMTRNAVIGKISRLKLPPRDRTVYAAKVPPKASYGERQRQATKSRVVRKTGPVLVMASVAQPRPDDVARKTLNDLEAVDCRWPVGDPRDASFGFCAAPRVPGASYCCDHFKVAYGRAPIIRTTVVSAPQPDLEVA